ncbi:hypothetical protein MNBD_PLANCTO03-702 [hydrothermal vent metagenome]|uniref:6-hydroxymethylpterin diphosphokinase MptE-like domain-containing protein n=1 Tax=hydrothermal vent metagenome TaxID=652676 RepID=A0A3B1E620_9ZZZZ
MEEQAGRRVEPQPGLLERNIQALGRCSPETAQLLLQARPRPDVEFTIAADGAVTASLGEGPNARQLASKCRPLDEARRLADRFDAAQAGVVVVQGFGLGHHVRLIAEKLGRTGVVLVYEPDIELLRAVLERLDLTAMFEQTNVAVLARADDAGAISATLHGAEVVVSLGVKIIEHGPSMPRLGERAQRFADAFTTTIRAIRTNVVTTLMQTETSLRNGLMNLDWYASVPGVAELTSCAHSRPAVVVSAGPSLRRNMALLAKPGVRERVVIIAVQTVLKQLLKAGIKPHFVTALDYHEISRRFYEGLTAKDVEGVTLVVEPKANPAILEAYPGAIRCVHDTILSKILGAGFVHDGQEMTPGATVAHMGYTLARHMGCDPVLLIGQDLGFTDGQYYAPGAAIHDTWAGELNEFNTLEMMEWQRVVRNRAHLRPAIDHLGRPVYSDEQMSAYLVQFERLFAADAEQGRTTIDATEGGVTKQHTERMPLHEALATFAPDEALPLDLPGALVEEELHRLTAPRVADRLAQLRHDIARVGKISRDSVKLLREMLAAHGDCSRVNTLIAKVNARGEEAQSISPAFELIQHLNQTGQFKRFKADRILHLDDSLSPLERQKQEIERDITNVEWLAESAAQLGKLFDAAERALRGKTPKLTRDPEEHGDTTAAIGHPARQRVAAIIPVDPQRGGLGTIRNLAWPVAEGFNPLQLTLARLCRCEGLDRIVLLTEHPERVREIVGDERKLHGSWGTSTTIHIEQTETHPLGERRHGVAAARAFAGDCWRGGLCGMTIWDEAFDPTTTLAIMDRLKLDAAVVVGADWAMVDPDLTEAVIERYREDPAHRRLTFTQAAPGLSPCVIDRSLVEELAASVPTAGAFASLGGLLGYIPHSPILDPVAKPGCVRVGPEVRDIGVRAIADSLWRCELLGRVFAGVDPVLLRAEEAGTRLRSAAEALAHRGPAHLTLELCPGRRTGGELAQLIAGVRRGLDRVSLGVAPAVRLLEELAAARPDATVTLGGAGDPMMHSQWQEVVSAARSAGLAAVHLRTDLQCETDEALRLLDCGANIISIDLLAETPESYRSLAGLADFARARENLVALLQARAERAGSGMPETWIVPRITRCDRVYAEIESFYDRWLSVSQACVIDPLPRRIEGDRIEPLAEPAFARWRRSLTELTVLSDGRVLVKPRKRSGKGAGNALDAGLIEVWSKVVRARQEREGLRTALQGRSAPATPAAA